MLVASPTALGTLLSTGMSFRTWALHGLQSYISWFSLQLAFTLGMEIRWTENSGPKGKGS